MIKLTKLVKQIKNGDRLSISRAITLVESTLPADRRLADRLIKSLDSNIPPSVRIGFTGSPGSGKSTLLESFGLYLLNAGKVNRLAVLAIDPSSTKSGGSILGDKTRMTGLSVHPRAFVRPSPARGSLGGITASTARAGTICQAAGHDLICIETVGVGQSETAIAAMSDITVLVIAPGGGDELQAIKKGVTECADIVVVNKCDLPGAKDAFAYYKNAIHLQDANSNGRERKVYTFA